jgi:hypothetical protein
MIEKILIDSKELAAMLSMSEKYIVKIRHKIVGAQRIGRMWRFNLNIIQQRLSVGKNIVVD